VPLLQAAGHGDQAKLLLDGGAATIRDLPRLGLKGYGVSDAQISARRGRKGEALAQLRTARQAGWRGPHWRWWPSRDPALALIRNEPEFRAVFAAIERDMARQRAEPTASPKDAPLDLGTSD
jgi:hypothetical protein